ncbi:MAG: Unknown protein [uncultured Sulfurovum sp.]|uniref:Uncharacterized protein n=1 Tax=uncultured Sulfurovum sp. TaxID=269237 RepID=A0A6S6UDN6_9BACT|nr:MAG: Unknown protein [uncultured Sulfurovum sp.]
MVQVRLEPTQELYLNLILSLILNLFLSLEPTQELYLNIRFRLRKTRL